MKRIVKCAIAIVAGFAGCTLAQATDSSSYTAIAARNVFGLVAPAVIVAPPPPEAPPKKITLGGFMTVFGRSQVLFKVAKLKNSPGDRNQEDSCVLAEGEQQDDVKVMHIDMTNGTATFLNHGTLQQIPLTDRK